MKFQRSRHSVFLLTYHLIMCVKYRREVINEQVGAVIKSIAESVAINHGVTIVELGHDKDHVHLLIKATPMSNLTKFIGGFKSASSRRIKVMFPEIRQKLWKEAFWSPSYFLTTTGGAPLDTLIKYVKSQNQGGGNVEPRFENYL